MLFEKVGLAFLAGWLLNNQSGNSPNSIQSGQDNVELSHNLANPPGLRQSPLQMPLMIPINVAQAVESSPPTHISSYGYLPLAPLDDYNKISATRRQTDVTEADKTKQVNSPFSPPPSPFSTEKETMQSAANREIPENEAAAQSRPRMMSAQRFAQKHRRKKEKARTESRKDIALVLRAPITLGHAAPGENPQPYVPVIYSAASTLSDRPAIFSYLQRLPHQYQEPFQFQSIPGFLGGPVIPNPTRNAIAIASGIEINHHNNPHKEKPVRSRLNRFFKKRAGHLSGSNGLISGHTHDNISHKKSFHLKFFHLPFLSIDFDSKIYKDESLVADIGRRTGRQSFIFSQ